MTLVYIRGDRIPWREEVCLPVCQFKEGGDSAVAKRKRIIVWSFFFSLIDVMHRLLVSMKGFLNSSAIHFLGTFGEWFLPAPTWMCTKARSMQIWVREFSMEKLDRLDRVLAWPIKGIIAVTWPGHLVKHQHLTLQMFWKIVQHQQKLTVRKWWPNDLETNKNLIIKCQYFKMY